jgi:glutamate/aspartate transport system permease protein
MKYNWNWGILLSPEPGATGTYLHYLIVGLGWTLATALAAWVIALVIGSIVGTLRTTTNPWVVRIGNGYVEIFRNIPAHRADVPLVLRLSLNSFPRAGRRHQADAPALGFYIPAVLCLGIFTSVRVAEQLRAGNPVASPRPAQCRNRDGPHAVPDLPARDPAAGLPDHHAAAHLRVHERDQELVGGAHDRALELTGRARAMQEFSFQVFEAFAAATVIYLLTNLIVVLGMRQLERKIRVPGLIAAGGAPMAGH